LKLKALRFISIASLSFCVLSGASSAQESLTVCNPKTDVTNVRSGPSAKGFPKVAEVPNGQVVDVIEKVTNTEGYEYYKIIYYTEMGNGQLIENEGFVYHEALAATCDANIQEVAESLTQWPLTVKRWGCEFTFPSETVMNEWHAIEVQTSRDIGGKANLDYGLCRVSDGEPVEIVNYLGTNAESSERHFRVIIDNCDMTYSAIFNKSSGEVSYSTNYGQDCHLYKKEETTSNQRPGFFAQWADNMFGGSGASTYNGAVPTETVTSDQEVGVKVDGDGWVSENGKEIGRVEISYGYNILCSNGYNYGSDSVFGGSFKADVSSMDEAVAVVLSACKR
jgi:Bacterial SH3 domain